MASYSLKFTISTKTAPPPKSLVLIMVKSAKGAAATIAAQGSNAAISASLAAASGQTGPVPLDHHTEMRLRQIRRWNRDPTLEEEHLIAQRLNLGPLGQRVVRAVFRKLWLEARPPARNWLDLSAR